MNHSPEVAVPFSIVVGGLAFLVGGLTVWAVAVSRVSRGLPVLPYARRWPVPWRAFHVGVIAAAYVMLIFLAQYLAVRLFELPVPSDGGAPPDPAILPNPLVVLLGRSHTLPTLLLCFLAAVIVAPIVEEFLFRLVLQGWLEAVDRQRRRQIPALRGLTPGAAPVVLVAMLFAGIHYRSPLPQVDPRTIAYLLAANIVASLLTLAFGVGLLRWDAGGESTTWGLAPGRFLGRLAACSRLWAVAAVILLAQDCTERAWA